MPSVKPPAKVLVSGASGYIAIWVIRSLLEHGYSVRGTVRSLDKAKHLRTTFQSHGDKFELVVVPDIARDGAFDEAVIGVDAIEHTASPFHTRADDPQELIQPAVRGTIGILSSALKYGSTLKRIVVTSSTAAVRSTLPEPKLFTEADFNEQAIQVVERDGRAASGLSKYQASKTLAEKAAWDFYNANKSLVQWDLVVLNPPFVFGPFIHEVAAPAALNTSVASWYEHVVVRKAPPPVGDTNNWIDVRDLAEAHVRVLEKQEAGGERFIVSAGMFHWQNWIDAADSKTPDLPQTGQVMFDTSKAHKYLGIQYRSMEETAKDCLKDFEAKGWLV